MSKKIISVLFLGIGLTLLYACGGNENKPGTEQPANQVISEKPASEVINGEEVYKKTCIACHQANGEGIAGTFPPLAKSDFLTDKSQVIYQVINGKTGEMTVNGVKYNSIMPPQSLSDEEIAAVLTYVYTSWGNTGGLVTPDEVKAIRSPKI